MRLHAAQKAVKYYRMIHRDLTPANMIWCVLKRFEEQRDALVERENRNYPIVPKLTKGISVPKWLESFYLSLRTVIGKLGIPLYYVVHDLSALSNYAPPSWLMWSHNLRSMAALRTN